MSPTGKLFRFCSLPFAYVRAALVGLLSRRCEKGAAVFLFSGGAELPLVSCPHSTNLRSSLVELIGCVIRILAAMLQVCKMLYRLNIA